MESPDQTELAGTTVTLTSIDPVDFQTYCMATGVSQVVEVVNNTESQIAIEPAPKPDTRAKRLVCRNGVIGYEKQNGFVVMTNFSLEVSGYVCEEGTVIGYLVKLLPSIKDDQMDASAGLVREYFLTNRDMSSQPTLLNALKSDGIWTAPSKDPYLPKYVYSLCQEYMKLPKDSRRKRIPVTTCGKQSDKDVWVINHDVQLDSMGCAIPPEEQVFLVVDGRIPLLPNVKTIDNGEALKELITAEKELFANNFPQALMTIACAGLAANYELVLHDIGCCSLPVLSGAAISGKTMALRCAMAIFGQKQLLHDVTFKSVMEQLARTTFPIGWDDADSKTVIKQVSVGTFNQGGTSNARGKLIPKTVPILTTAIDKKEIRSLSRLLCIPFQPLETVYKGRDLLSRCARLNAAMDNASKSIGILLSYLNKVLITAQTSEDFDTVTDELQQFVDAAGLNVDHRALRMYALLMFVCVKILEKVELTEEVPTIWTTMKKVVIPDSVTLPPPTPDPKVLLATPLASTPTIPPTPPTFCTPGTPAYNNFPQTPGVSPGILNVEETLKAFVKYVADNVDDEICSFFAPKVKPVKCSCGEVIAFNAPQSAGFIRQHIEGAHTISDASLRNFVKRSKIGCVGKCLQFHGSERQRTSIHITRAFFSLEELKYLDDAFEKVGYSRRIVIPSKKKRKTSRARPESPETGIFVPASEC